MIRTYAKYAVITLLAAGLTLAGAVAVSAQNSVDDEIAQAVAKLNPEQKAALLLLVKGIVDAQVPQESPEEGAMKTVKAYVKAAEEANLEVLMDQISEKFNHYEVGNKAGYRTFLEQVKGEGMLEDISGNTEDAKAEVAGDKVTIYPVELEGLFGTVTLEFELKKDGDVWKITGLDMTGA